MLRLFLKHQYYLFDDIPGEKFCAESLVLHTVLEKNYLMLFLMKNIHHRYLSDGLSVFIIKNKMNSLIMPWFVQKWHHRYSIFKK